MAKRSRPKVDGDMPDKPKKRSKGIKKVIQGGNIIKFNEFVLLHRDNKSDFKVTSRGLSRTVEFKSGKKFRFFGQGGSSAKNKIDGAYIVNMVKVSVDRYIDNYGVVSKREPVVSQTFNCDAINTVINKPICCLDLNLCYWRTAFLLGYIDESLYRRGIDTGYKKGMLVSIGALNANPIIQHYENGKEVSKSYDTELNSRYSPFYWSIIGKVNDLMMEVHKALKDDMYMWLTDCAFIAPERRKDVLAIFDKYGFPCKTYTSDFTFCDGNTIEWYDCKDAKFKTISVGGRHIKPLYNRWKHQRKFYAKNTILEDK